MSIWHPVKWWYQYISARAFDIDSDDKILVGFGPQGDPPGQLDSGWYWREFDEISGQWIQLAPLWYQCLSCCCAPQKCNMPDEILMTLSGFDGTMSSIDYPSDYGYGPTNNCPCPITYVHNCALVRDPICNTLIWQPCWDGFTEECCKCRRRENYYWWPRDLSGNTGGDKCAVDRPICDLFPHLCAENSQSVRYFGRIAGRWMDLWPVCTRWGLGDIGPDGQPIDMDLIKASDCAEVPGVSALPDFLCLSQIQSPFRINGFLPTDVEKDVEIVRSADSYLFPPGFKGVESKNLLPLCDNKFWNDSTYYRHCVEGGFWCYEFFGGLPDPRYQKISESQWCADSPTRCRGPVKVTEINWQYFRPKYVLLSQPSGANCRSCFSGISNPLLRDDPFNPWGGSQDGHCNGKTDVAMADFNRTMVMRSRVYNAPPVLQTVVRRHRIPPPDEKLINAQLLYSLMNDGYTTTRWRVDYPCEPKRNNRCSLSAGLVQPKLRAFYTGESGYDANIEFEIRIYCPPPISNLANYGSTFNGGYWYVSAAGVKAGEDEEETERNRGTGYKVGDIFIFDYFESPLRGGESYWPTFFGVVWQELEVTSVGNVGQILAVRLRSYDGRTEFREELPLNIGCGQFDPDIIKMMRPPLYARAVPHRYAVAIPGNAYEEGDIIVFEARQSPPTGNIETGSKFRPYLSTTLSTRSQARATVLDVDSKGGIIDWHLCFAENVVGDIEQDFDCVRDDRGDYYDIQYANQCEYEYQGFLPVRYAWSGLSDVRFRGLTYCEHAWAEFFFRVEQISVKNDVQVLPPLQPWGRQAKLRIKSVDPDMRINGVEIDPLYYQNYEMSPGPSMFTNMVVVESEGAWYKKHPFPIKQGGILEIEVVDPGAGYVMRLPKVAEAETNLSVKSRVRAQVSSPTGAYMAAPFRALNSIDGRSVLRNQQAEGLPPYPDGPEEDGVYEPIDLAAFGWVRIRSVVDDMRNELLRQGLDTYCKFNVEIDMDKTSKNFGGIKKVTIEKPGLWYFEHEHEHVWFARAGSNWFFELAAPVPDYSDDFVAPDCSVNISAENPCCHASRDNWGELHHFDGFCEPFPSGYYERYAERDGGFYRYFRCDVISDITGGTYAWPQSQNHLPSGTPGIKPAGDFKNRWSVNFCPTDLLQRSYRMLLLHPCAACAKELNIPGAQTCWNMNGLPDSTYSPPGWSGTGTAMITRLGGELRCRTSILGADL